MRDLDCTRTRELLVSYLLHLSALEIYNREFSDSFPWCMEGKQKFPDKYFFVPYRCPVIGCNERMSYYNILARRKIKKGKFVDAPRLLPLYVHTLDELFELNGNKLILAGESPQFGICPNNRHETVRLFVYNRNPVRKNDSGYLIHQFVNNEWKLVACPT